MCAYEDIENHDLTKLLGMGVPYGRDMIMPDRIFLGNSSVLGSTTWNFSPSGTPVTDMAMALRWEPVVVHPTSMLVVEFNYGLPYPGFDRIKEQSPEIIPITLEITSSPNPFNGQLSITVNNPFPSEKNSSVFITDIRGKEISSLFSGFLKPGSTRFHWIPDEGTPSGLYLVNVRMNRLTNSDKVLYIR